MICNRCSMAADIQVVIRETPNSFERPLIEAFTLSQQLHSNCRGCDCAHKDIIDRPVEHGEVPISNDGHELTGEEKIRQAIERYRELNGDVVRLPPPGGTDVFSV